MEKWKLLLNYEKSERKYEKISASSLIIFAGMSVSWLTLPNLNLKFILKFVPYLHANEYFSDTLMKTTDRIIKKDKKWIRYA